MRVSTRMAGSILLIVALVIAALVQLTGVLSDRSPADTAESFELTSTAIIAGATATAAALPEGVLTTVDALSLADEDCTPGTYFRFVGDVSQQVTDALVEGDLKDVAVGVSVTIEESTNCETVETQEVLYAINIPVDDLADEQRLAALTADVLDVLAGLTPLRGAPTIRPAKLSLRFDRETQQRVIDVDYHTSLGIYADGLRGHDLINALGGLRDN
jgi:hypothetical protein